MVFKKKYQIIILLTLISNCFSSCIEPFEVQSEVFENALIIEGTITNEFINQEILLNRAFRLEELVPAPEENANVKIIDDEQNEFVFQEISPGKYLSTSKFSAQPDRSYQLIVNTNDGKTYTSYPTKYQPPVPIYNLRASRRINNENEEGVTIFVDYEPTQDSKYFRYEYEETYKIIAPKWSPFEFEPIAPTVYVPVSRTVEERVCYNTNTEFFKNLITHTEGVNGVKLSELPIRFINRNNYIISHRYSLLVKQFTISKEAYLFFEKLKSFSGEQDAFSQTQPGFFSGNVFSEDNLDEKVLGYFDVTSVTTKRIFFNYVDFFPNEPLPPYVSEDCVPFIVGPGTNPSLGELIDNNLVRYQATINSFDFSVVSRICADCTVVGTIEVPEFWIE